MKRWTMAEINFIQDNMDMTDKDIARELGRSKGSVAEARRRAGIAKTDRMGNPPNIYYLENRKTGEFIAMGKVSEIAKKIGKKRQTIYYYAMKPPRSKTFVATKVEEGAKEE